LAALGFLGGQIAVEGEALAVAVASGQVDADPAAVAYAESLK
jgi:hypothetical protein